jgi:D-arabinitol 2-dehydrogenase
MFRSQLIRQAARAARASQGPTAARSVPTIASQRKIHVNLPLQQDDKKGHEGSFARTDSSVQVEYPGEGELPSSTPVQGRGGLHFKRTLASFSLEGRVGVVTGGARGLGLVMSQAMIISGADLAIVDLNSRFKLPRLRGFTEISQRRRQKSKPRDLY